MQSEWQLSMIIQQNAEIMHKYTVQVKAKADPEVRLCCLFADVLFDLGSLADTVTQIVQFRASDFAPTGYVDLLDQR